MKTCSLTSKLAIALFLPFVTTELAHAESLTTNAPAALSEFDKRHDDCLEKVTVDADEAYEDALIWKGDGGGRRARHCVAMALFALGHEEEAATRLEDMAGEILIGTPAMRADYFAEAADFWLASGEAHDAYRAASSGLEVSEEHLDLRLARARAYAYLERWDYAEIDLSSAIAFHPKSAKALRYRADARRKQGKLGEALIDIQKALEVDPSSVESALVRGQIREDIRMAASTPEE